MRKACGNFETGGPQAEPCCEHSVNIAVKNCEEFYVYYLRPTPSCPMAYCAGDKVPCPIGKWSPNGLPPCKDAFPVMHTSPTLTGPIVYNASFEFQCDVHYPSHDPDQQAEVVWTFDGQEDPAVLPQILTDPASVATLDGSFLKGHINTNVGCQVRTFYKGNSGHKSAFLRSNTYYAGIQINPVKVDVSEKDYETNITITNTVPITCDHDLECCLVFKLDVDRTTDLSIQTMCDYSMCTSDWDPVLKQAVIEVPVLANRDLIKDGTVKSMISFEELLPSGGGRYLEVFNGHKPNQVPVSIHDAQTFTCSITGDPHIRGFDSSTKYHLFKTGDFTAYEAPNRDFQVQIRTWPCGNGRVTCICGVTVRERNDIVKVNQCDQPYQGRHTSPTVDIAHDLSAGTVVERSRNGNHIGVFTASGSEVKIDASNTQIQLYITTPGIDASAAFGLCGTNDGDPDNEFTHPDGTKDPTCKAGDRRCIPDTFEEAWRSTRRTSLFENVPNTVQVDDDVKYCTCDANRANRAAVACSYRKQLSNRGVACQGCRNITQSLVPSFLQGQGWTKRSTVFADLDEVDAPYVMQQLPDVDPNKAWPNDQGITESHAQTMCSQALRKSQLWQACGHTSHLVSDAMNDCMSDILFGGNTEFVKMAADAFTTQCQQELAQDPASYETDASGKRIMKSEFLGDICPPECDDHGHCGHGGKCVCDHGWEGEVCHIQSGAGPVLDRIRSGPLCDLTQRPCQRVYLDVTNIDLCDDLVCRIQDVDDNGQNVGPSVSTPAAALSAHRIACDITETNKSSRQMKISASNDGILFGNELSLHVYDSTCMDCTGTGCTEKTTACHINNKCYTNGASHDADNKLVCDITKNIHDWTVVATSAPALSFLPTIKGPNSDYLMTCSFFPSPNVKGDFQVTWYVDDKVEVTEMVTAGQTQSLVSVGLLPTTGKLRCEVKSESGATSESTIVDLSTVARS